MESEVKGKRSMDGGSKMEEPEPPCPKDSDEYWPRRSGARDLAREGVHFSTTYDHTLFLSKYRWNM